MAETMALKNRAAAEGDAVRLEKITSTNVTSINDTTTEKFDVKAENAKILKAEQAKLAEQQAAMRNFQNINAVNNSTGATTVNQTQVHSSGEPSTEHSDLTARHLIAASYA
jgi:secreted trypsin-like serine protease